jgi:hypothetical protein
MERGVANENVESETFGIIKRTSGTFIEFNVKNAVTFCKERGDEQEQELHGKIAVDGHDLTMQTSSGKIWIQVATFSQVFCDPHESELLPTSDKMKEVLPGLRRRRLK